MKNEVGLTYPKCRTIAAPTHLMVALIETNIFNENCFCKPLRILLYKPSMNLSEIINENKKRHFEIISGLNSSGLSH